MNAYAYAPKDDAKHRARVARAVRRRRDRAIRRARRPRGATAGVRFGFAVSPGLDIDYESDADRAAAARQAARARRRRRRRGSCCSLDDIPMQPGLAPAPGRARGRAARRAAGAIAGRRADGLPDRVRRDAAVAVPRRRSAAGLPADVDVMWTGPTVCSPTITAADAARPRPTPSAAARRSCGTTIPVNDATMTASLHLGPYRGRDPELARGDRAACCAIR